MCGMVLVIVIQFVFDVDFVLVWLDVFCMCGIIVLVLVGVLGLVSIFCLLCYVVMCGVGVSVLMLVRYGILIGWLLGMVGLEVFVDCLVKGLISVYGLVSLYFYLFGGVVLLLDWMVQYWQCIFSVCSVIFEG